VANCTIREEQLDRRTGRGRFAHSPPLRHLEAQWSEAWPQALATPAAELKCSIRATACPNREAEAIMAAREILRFVRRGGRYREVTLLARSLEPYHELLANIFHRYEIPFFLDRRESVSRHPLAELTRNALRTVASGWAHEDWFGALKTGLAPAQEADIDRLENEALARGWKGSAWQKPLTAPDLPEKDAGSLEKLRLRIVPPFNKLAMKMAQHRNQPTGPELADGINEFWTALGAADTLERWSSDEEDPRAIHLTVWDQMAVWLENVKLAFATERLPLRDWLPILDAGLSELTVGVIPPALDQVFIGAIDRSRNPDIRLAIVLGMNEGIFPAPPAASVLLTDADRQALDRQGVPVANNRQQAGRERFYAYVALTRAREQLVLSYSESDSQGKRLNPSAFLGQMKRLFPSLEVENFSPSIPWQESEHASELVAPLLESMAHPAPGNDPDLARLETLPELAPMMGKIRLLTAAPMEETLSPALAARLYTPVLRTSVSRMEQFAACPFKFFVHSGLRAEERKFFELDSREQGNYQHEVLEQFHRQVLKEGKRWRDVTPEQARERIGAIAAAHARDFHDGLLQATEKSRFTARMLTESLQDFVETIVEWLREQYEFDPAQVELRFGEEDANPAWRLELGEGRRIELRGRIDRVDLYRAEDRDEALCVVMDYKSGVKKLDALLMEHGIQLQLAAYLNVLRHWKDPRALFGVGKLVPAGVFYVSLRGQYKAGKSRSEALADAQTARKKAYRHTGRFDECALPQLDSRPDAVKGDQFNYSINRDGAVSKSSKEALPAAEFTGLLDHVEAVLTRMGQEIYAGTIRVDPFRKKNSTACEHCDYQAVCRIDPWTHTWRVLRAAPEPEEEPE